MTNFAGHFAFVSSASRTFLFSKRRLTVERRANRESIHLPPCCGCHFDSRIACRNATAAKSSVESSTGLLRTANRGSNRQPDRYGRQIERRIGVRRVSDAVFVHYLPATAQTPTRNRTRPKLFATVPSLWHQTRGRQIVDKNTV